MKKLLIVAFLAISVFAGYGQESTGSLTGRVKDRETGETIPFANVAIMSEKVPVSGGQTDFDGKYTIRAIPVGTYTVQCSCIGYVSQQVTGIVIGADKVTPLNFTLQPTTETLESVEIIDYKIPIFESIAFSEVGVDKKTKGVFSKDGSISSGRNNIKSGTLTSGEVNDFAKWHLWNNVLNSDFQLYTELWGFFPVHRYIAQLTNKRGMPLANAQVTLQNSNGEVLWRAKTDNTGKAELWIDFFKSETKTDMINLKIVFEYEGQTAEIANVTPFKRGINTAQIDVSCHERNKVDIFFMVDATGSMGDEIRYLQVELEDIIRKIHKQQSELQLRVGALVYRDHGDEYLTRKSSLNSDINETLDFLRKQSANGGGDYPEAVDVALYESVTGEDWDDDALARILFIVLDAPSHTNPEVLERLESQLRLAAKKGIRIVPIACSDIKKDGEYLMRTFALATNGTYLFLTDDSGVGNAHIKPSTDKYDVEKLNDAMVRVVKQYTKMPDCNNPKWAKQNKNAEPSDKFVPNPYDEKAEEDSDKLTASDIIKVYPNPCRDILKIELKKSE
ncbi:MAG: carboxypeptidase regulatory-like domain-containing protein [Bacteroidales bacterium]|nr:carboxypeptidase regulatory-like domain-containing protein [Bacteroidales bacterium]